MWNNTDIPLAILITFRCYGTWLHGDERGSVDRHNNIFRTPTIPTSNSWEKHNQEQLKYSPVLLNAKQRRAVEKAFAKLVRNADGTFTPLMCGRIIFTS